MVYERTGEQSRLLAGGHHQCTRLTQTSQYRIAGRTGHEGLG